MTVQKVAGKTSLTADDGSMMVRVPLMIARRAGRVSAMEDNRGYATVYWGKMPVNCRSQAFPKGEVEGAVGYANRSFRDALDLVPDFSVLTLVKDPKRDTKAVLVLGDEREPRVFRRGAQEERSLEGLLWEVALKHPVAEPSDATRALPAGVSIPEVVLLGSLFRWRLVAVLVASVFAVAVGGGALFALVLG